jgi:hypothetical protein
MTGRWAHCGFCGGPMLVGLDGRCMVCERKIGEPVRLEGTNAFPPPPPCRTCGGALGARGPASGGVIQVVCSNCGDEYAFEVAVQGDAFEVVVQGDTREASIARHPASTDPVVYPTDETLGFYNGGDRVVWVNPPDLDDDERHDLMGPDLYSPVARAEWDD